MQHTIYIGLGTNLQGQSSDKATNIDNAIRALRGHVGTLLKCSSYIESEPWGFESDNKFLNAVAVFETDLPPLKLLDETQKIEFTMGRSHKSRNGEYHDRVIDIDILYYDHDIVALPGLTIPHPLLHKRDFVLIPLAEVAPDYIHPQQNKTNLQLLNDYMQKATVHTCCCG